MVNKDKISFRLKGIYVYYYKKLNKGNVIINIIEYIICYILFYIY